LQARLISIVVRYSYPLALRALPCARGLRLRPEFDQHVKLCPGVMTPEEHML